MDPTQSHTEAVRELRRMASQAAKGVAQMQTRGSYLRYLLAFRTRKRVHELQVTAALLRAARPRPAALSQIRSD